MFPCSGHQRRAARARKAMTEVYIYRPPHKTYHALAGCDRGRSPASTPGVWKISCRVPDITPLLGHACIVDTNPNSQLCSPQGRLTSVDTLLRRRQRKENGRRIQWRCAPAPDPISGRLVRPGRTCCQLKSLFQRFDLQIRALAPTQNGPSNVLVRSGSGRNLGRDQSIRAR